MTLSRREFLSVSALGSAAFLLEACKGKSDAYKAYLKHIETRGIGLPTGKVLHYKEFGEARFEDLNALINSRVLTVKKEPPTSDFTISDQDPLARFYAILALTNASVQSQFERQQHNIAVYYNPGNTDITVDQETTGSLIDWVVTTPQLDPVTFKGEIRQHVLIHNFQKNPLNPITPKSLSTITLTEEGMKLALTVINLNSQRGKFDGPDNGFVTELIQARLNIGGLEQEQWASSIALAYEYAVLNG